MKNKLCFSTALLFVLSLLSQLVPPSAAAERCPPFRIGVISLKPDQILESFELLAKYLEKNSKPACFGNVTIVVAKDMDQMHGRIAEGAIDFVLESAFPTVKLEHEGMVPTLLAWKKGLREYRTLFFVRRESPVKNLQDLKGKIVVFETASSTSAYAVPKAELTKNGLFVTPLENEHADREAVRYEFAGEAINQAFWVIKKRADAGAFNNSDWAELAEKERQELRIIHETKPILRFLGSFNPLLPTERRVAVENALLGMHKNASGRRALARAFNTSKFERLSEDDRKSLQYVKELFTLTD